MADTQITGTLSVDNAINGSLSANEGINGSLTPDEEISGTLEVTRTRVVATMLSELEDVELDDLQDDDILVYDSLDGKWHNEANAGGGGVWGTITGTLSDQTDLQAALDEKYGTNDTAETDIADADYIPFYDTSASAKRKSLWSNIKAKLNEIFFTRSENNILGAKNIMPNNLVAETSDVVTYTRNSDGSVTIDTGGSASTVVTYCDMIPDNPHTTSWHPLSDFPTLKKCCEEGRTITLSGSDNANVRVTLAIRKGTSIQDFEIQCQGSEVSGQLPSDDIDNRYVYYYLRVASGTTLSNKKVYPMVRLATDTDSGFEPFAMTNKALTDKFGTLGSASTKDVPASGDAGQTEVVLGSDTRLTDARTPTSHTHTTTDITDFPALAAVATSGSYSDLTGAPTIPDELADLSDDATHRLVTDTEKTTWNDKCDNTVVAPVENGTTASQAYAIGAHFIKDGAFCTAKTAITAGETLTLNTNYTTGQVADVGRSGWKNATMTPASGSSGVTNYGTMTAFYNKSLCLGYFQWKGNATTPTAGNYDFVLPADMKTSSFDPAVIIRNGNYIEIRRTENIVRVSLTTATYSLGVLMYPIV